MKQYSSPRGIATIRQRGMEALRVRTDHRRRHEPCRRPWRRNRKAMRRRPGSANPMACSGPGMPRPMGHPKSAPSASGRRVRAVALMTRPPSRRDVRHHPITGPTSRRDHDPSNFNEESAGRPFAGKREPSACPAEATPTMVSDGGRPRSPDPSRSAARRSPNARGGSRWLQAHAHPRRWPHPAKTGSIVRPNMRISVRRRGYPA